MKTMKLALLGGAALAVSAVAAQAEDLTTLKAEIEALNARLQQLEAAPAVPTGYSLLTMSSAPRTVVPGNEEGEDKGIGDTANVIGILPTADAAPSTTIEWSGYVYAMVQHVGRQDFWWGPGSAPYDTINTRAHLRVVGRTDTAVGEVGVRVNLRASGWYGDVDSDPSFYSNEYWGWWAMTPELTLGGGYSGSLGNIGYGIDGACTCWGTDWFAGDWRTNSPMYALGAMNPGDTHQVRLSYASGPLSFGLALENSHGGSDGFALAGEMKYAGDAFNGEISAISWDDSPSAGGGWQIGGGVAFNPSDMFSISLGAATGEIWDSSESFMVVSGLVNINLSDAVHAELGAAYGEFDHNDQDNLTLLAGIYYSPVSQLTIGLEGQMNDVSNGGGPDYNDFSTVDIVTVYNF